ncbi:PilW family protein [Pseudomonas sp. DWP3-1-2]|uniref:PilW family protein n=1 Tax=Pseudomonas sp. DWP3-1-2 TaxID=2804645 RepID=UPI003CF216CE
MRAPQQGFNLVSLMIGMTLSMVSILAMLSLYKNIIGISVMSIQDATQDGQIAAGLMIAQRELLNAGFRIDPNAVPVASRAVLLSGATLNAGTLAGTAQTIGNTAVIGNAMVWISKATSTATATCAGLLVQNGVLSRLQGPSGCTQVSQWNSTSWTATTLIEANQPAAFFTAQYAGCWPFGKIADATSGTTRVQVVLTATNSTVDPNSTDPQPAYVKSKSTVCLPNLEKV